VGRRRKAGAMVTRRSSANRRRSVDACGCCRRRAAAAMTARSVAVKVEGSGGWVGGWVGNDDDNLRGAFCRSAKPLGQHTPSHHAAPMLPFILAGGCQS